MTSGQLFVSNMLRVAATGITGAAGAVAFATTLSKERVKAHMGPSYVSDMAR
jgi:hypothetical protein